MQGPPRRNVPPGRPGTTLPGRPPGSPPGRSPLPGRPPGPGGPPSAAGDPFGDPDDFTVNEELPVNEGGGGASDRVQPGIFRGRLVALVKALSKAKNPMWVWHFMIIDGGFTDEDFSGKIVKLHTALTDAAMWKVTETVEALELGEGGKSLHFTKDQALNRECVLFIEPDQQYVGSLHHIAPLAAYEKELERWMQQWGQHYGPQAEQQIPF